MDQQAAKNAFGRFINVPSLNQQQIRFLNTTINCHTLNGTTEPATFYELPFTDIASNGLIDVFNQYYAAEIVHMVERTNHNALTNQHCYKKHSKRYRSKRQMVATFFAQMCDQFNLNRNYAKSYEGLLTRISSKFSVASIFNRINIKTDKSSLKSNMHCFLMAQHVTQQY
jgi:hypothetical protein